MLQPIHAIGRKREMTPERIIGLGFVGVLHVVAISAIVFGLRQHYAAPAAEGPITVVPVKEIKTTVKPPLPNVELSNQRQVTVVPPHIDIAHETHAIVDTTTQPLPPQPVHERVASIPDTAATGMMGTHSSPAYPLLDRRLGMRAGDAAPRHRAGRHGDGCAGHQVERLYGSRRSGGELGDRPLALQARDPWRRRDPERVDGGGDVQPATAG